MVQVSLVERDYILKNVDKIIFNSKWSRDRFYLDIKNKELTINKSLICYQSTSKVPINFRK